MRGKLNEICLLLGFLGRQRYFCLQKCKPTVNLQGEFLKRLPISEDLIPMMFDLTSDQIHCNLFFDWPYKISILSETPETPYLQKFFLFFEEVLISGHNKVFGWNSNKIEEDEI